MWNKKAETAYWEAHDSNFHAANILKKYKFFDVDSYFDKDVKLAVDIGGGAFGGVLPFFKAKNKILVDALCYNYRLLGMLPSSIDSISCDFGNIPLAEGCADVVFAWNVFDHADSLIHYHTGVMEAQNIVKEGGLIFAAFPMRKQPNDNHPICITRQNVLECFNWASGWEMVDERIIGKPDYNDDILFIVARKL